MKKTLISMAWLLLVAITAQASVTVGHLRVNDLKQPLGIDTPMPTFSWQIENAGRGFVQQSYAITVRDASGNAVWTSGTIRSDRQFGIAYAGTALQSCAAYAWNVTVVGNNGETASAGSTFETAFM